MYTSTTVTKNNSGLVPTGYLNITSVDSVNCESFKFICQLDYPSTSVGTWVAKNLWRPGWLKMDRLLHTRIII